MKPRMILLAGGGVTGSIYNDSLKRRDTDNNRQKRTYVNPPLEYRYTSVTIIAT